jgi:hypothetical protein
LRLRAADFDPIFPELRTRPPIVSGGTDTRLVNSLLEGLVEVNMNRHDREFLDRQMRRLQTSPRPVGVVMLITAGVLLAGVAAGTMIFTSQRFVETSSTDGKKALAFLLNGGRTDTR